MRVFFGCASSTALLTALMILVVPAAAQEGPTLPEGQGRDVVATACGGCHGMDRLTAAEGRNAGEWRDTVIDMVGRGAQIFPEEIDPIVQYLAEHFGPSGGANEKP